MKKLLAALMAMILIISCFPAACFASENTASLDYSGIVLSRVFATGDKKDASCKYSFVELYNTTNKDLSLSGLSLYYSTSGNEAYVEYDLPDDIIPAAGYYLIRCDAAKKYNDANAIISLKDWDAEWNISFDTKELALILAPSDKTFSVSEHLDSLPGTISYFCMSEEWYFDTGYVDDLGKSKVAVRTELREDSGWYLLNLTKANSDKLNQVLPHCSDGIAADIVRCALSEVTFSMPAGVYEKGFDLTLGAPEGYDIYYTLDGSDPLTSSKAVKYTGAFTLTDTGAKGYGDTTKYVASKLGKTYLPADSKLPGGWVVKAYATNDVETTAVFTSSYFISPVFAGYSTDVVSISMELEDFVGDEGFYNNYHVYDAFLSNPKSVATVEVFDEAGTRRGYSNVDISISGHGSARDFDMKSMKINYKKNYNQEAGRETKLNYDPFDGSALNCKGQSITTFDRLILRSTSHDQQAAMMRDLYHQEMSAGDEIDTQAGSPVLVFINGEFWGVYNFRERYCAEYFERHYGVNEDNVALLENDFWMLYNGDALADYLVSDGPDDCADDFNELAKFIRTHDLTNKADYQYVCSKLDIHSLMDMYITRLYFSNLDWPGNNVKVWRNLAGSEDQSGMDAKWRFVMMDCDFGSCGAPDTQDVSVTSNYYNYMDQKFSVLGAIMSSMLKNEEFRNEYLARFYRSVCEDFDYETVALPTIQRLVAERENLAPLNIKRWNINTMSNYRASIEALRDFAQRRRGYAIQYLCDYFHISEAKLRQMAGYTEPDFYGASCDFFYINGVQQNPECGASEWMDANLTDRIVNGSNGLVRTIAFKGWAGFTQGIEAFGYRINDNEPVFSASFALTAEPTVKLGEHGGTNASRFKITVPLAGLSGENKIAVLVKVGGQIYELDGAMKSVNTLHPCPNLAVTYYCDAESAPEDHVSARDTAKIDGTQYGSIGNNPEISEYSLIGQAGKNMTVRGWHANIEGIDAFGYRIDGGEAVCNKKNSVSTEQAVYDAAFAALGNCAVSRYQMSFPIVSGTHTVEIFCNTGNREILIWTIKYSTEAAPVEPVDPSTDAHYHGGCFDSLFVNGDLAKLMNGQGGNGSVKLDAVNRTVDGTDGSIYELGFKGWIGFEEPITAFGYQIDDGNPVFGNFAVETEDAVRQPVNGGSFAKRFYVTVPVSSLEGTHSICVVVKVNNTVVRMDAVLPPTGQPAPNTSLTYLAPNPTQPEEPVDPEDPEEPTPEIVTVTIHAEGETYTVSGETGDFTSLVVAPEVEGLRFAGWYADEDLITPANIINVTEDTDVYARYINEDYFTVQIIYTTSKKVITKGRIVTVVDDRDNYLEVGFEIKVNGETSVYPLSKDYASVSGYSPVKLYNGVDKHSRLIYQDIKLDGLAAGTEIEIVPYYVTADGSRINGTPRNVTYFVSYME